MKIGFTGTREGMSENQKTRLKEILKWHKLLTDLEFHHGDCVGADEQAHDLAKFFGYKIHIHPPRNNNLRAFCFGEDVVLYYPEDYLIRNRTIARSCDLLIGAPKDDNKNRSGTWYTINYAGQLGKKIIILEK